MNELEYMKYVDNTIKELIEKFEKEHKFFSKTDLPERMNSYERNLCIPLYSNELLIETVEYYLIQSAQEFSRNGKYEFSSTYNDELKHNLIHLLLERLKQTLKGKE